jgi:hypothetical protein
MYKYYTPVTEMKSSTMEIKITIGRGYKGIIPTSKKRWHDYKLFANTVGLVPGMYPYKTHEGYNSGQIWLNVSGCRLQSVVYWVQFVDNYYYEYNVKFARIYSATVAL